jgi:neutral ceramidase
MTLRAGAASRDISPTRPMFLFGYAHVPRLSNGTHDPLLVAALYLHDSGPRARLEGQHRRGAQSRGLGEVSGEANAVLFVAADVLMLSHDVIRACRATVGRQTGIPEGNILISTTHTHSAPVTANLLAFRDDHVVPPADPEYLDRVSGAIVEAAVEAQASAVPACAAVTRAIVAGIGGNRHDPNGPRDPEVGILYLRELRTGRPLALSAIYSMHPTVLHEDSTLASADFPGYARLLLAEGLPGVKVLYHTGPSGNQSPRYHVSGQTFAEAERLGRALGAAILDAVRALRDSDFSTEVPVAAAQAFVELPGRHLPTVKEAEQALAAAVAQFERLKAEGAPHGPTRTAEVAALGAEEQFTLARAQEQGELEVLRRDYTPVEVQVLRVKDTFFAGLPGELFVEYGLEIKAGAPGRSFVISLANGELQGYIVTPDAAGYEASFSIFAPQAGHVLVEAALELMYRLSG